MSPDPARCPLCGEPNACRMAAGAAGPCWCATMEFPAALLARVPAEARNEACICSQCVQLAEGKAEGTRGYGGSGKAP